MAKLKDLRELSRKNTVGKDEFICQFQNATDITKIIRRGEFESRDFAKKLVPFFKKNDDVETCELVWKFLCKYIEYKAEPKEKQTGKTIAKFFLDKKGDCKHYSTTSVGILNACGIPAWFVVVRQSNDRTRFHAYCQALANGKIITVDPCRKKRFNSECEFVKKYSIQPINRK